MGFEDPVSITVNAVAQSMPRTGSGINLGTFRQADGTNDVKIAHQYGKRTRREFRFNDRKIAADPFDSTLNKEVSMSAYLVVDLPPQGYTITEAQNVVDGLLAYLTASSSAKLIKFLGGES